MTWSPDGQHLAFVTRVRDARYEIDDPKRQPPRRVTRFFSRLDNVGWTHDRPSHIHIVATDGSGAPTDVTPGEYAFDAPAWSPDGRTLAFSGAAHDTWDLDNAEDLFTWSIGDDAAAAVTKQTGVYGSPAWSPDGGTIAFIGVDEPLKSPQNSHLGILDVAGGTHRWVGTSIDRTFSPYGEVRAPIWDGDVLLAAVEDRGRTHLYRVRTDGSGGADLAVGGERCVTGFDRAGATLAFAATTPEHPAEVFVVCDGAEHRASQRDRRLRDGGGAAAGRTVHGHLHRRRRGRRVGVPPGRHRAGPAPSCAPERPRRSVHAVRRAVLRRGAAAGLGRVRRHHVQPARFVGPGGVVGPGHQRSQGPVRPRYGLGVSGLRRRDGGH